MNLHLLRNPPLEAAFTRSIEVVQQKLIASEYWRLRHELLHSFLQKSRGFGEISSGDGGVVELSSLHPHQGLLQELVRSLIPWRIGPLLIDGLLVDAEWQSNLKWNLVRPYLGSLENKFIVDVGASNGYFSLKTLLENPKLVVAIDPNERCWLQLQLVSSFSHPRIVPLPLPLTDLADFDEYFDLTLCMGVLYHQRHPVSALGVLKQTTKKGGRIVVETLGVPGDSTDGLAVTGRYAKMRNVTFVPTAAALNRWMKESGLVNIQVDCFARISCDEQRRTEFAPYESLADFLDPSDPTKTVEGYPAPIRIIGVGFVP